MQTPLIPLSPEEPDSADAALKAHRTLKDQLGWKTEHFRAVEKAIEDQWKQPNMKSDPELARIDSRIDLDSDAGRPITAIILLREAGTAINRILESGETISRTTALVAAGNNPERAGKEALADFEMFAEPFRRAGASYARKGYSHNSIIKEVDAISVTLLRRFGPAWTNATGDGDLLAYLLARPAHEAVWEAEKIIDERDGASPSEAKTRAPFVRRQQPRPIATVHGKEFKHSDDYCSITYRDKSFRLTQTAGKIVRMLHEAYTAGKVGAGSAEIRKHVQCGKVWDQFRRRDGRRFWATLITRTEKDFFQLDLRPRVDPGTPRR
jgi:hypothetical protein